MCKLAVPYYHKIFIFAVLEWCLIYDCETECSFVYLISYYKIGLLSMEPMVIKASCQRAGLQMTGHGQKNDMCRLWNRHLICNTHAAPHSAGTARLV